ncbi:MAG: uracil phosphoribosyltransferase [Chlorobiales bacterium]|nr:uracil phosphoribosyltransferase [Chlorobiales bacterium]
MRFTVIDHSLIKRDLSILRERNTPNSVFRERTGRIAEVMAVEIFKQIEVESYTLETTSGYRIKGHYVLAPVLRAGLGLLDGFLKFLPEATVSHIGVSRDEVTHQPNYYYSNIPAKLQLSQCFILDPMLATGGSAIMAVDLLKKKGATKLTLVSVVAAPEGVNALSQVHPDVTIYAAALDRELNSNKYILPGLGDAGDRMFGT